MPRVLLPGGSRAEAESWRARGYEPTLLDVDPGTKPDIVASMVDMGDIGTYDAVFCCNALEHLYPHEVLPALAEFHRVLVPGGSAVVIVPDLEDVRPTEDMIPEIGMPGLHLYYGDPALIGEFPFMAHHCGFVTATLRKVLLAVGFRAYMRRLPAHQLMGVGIKA